MRPAPAPADLLRAVLPAGDVLDDAAACAVYARDASHLTLGRPAAVALPRNAAAAAAVVQACAAAGVPVVCRGAGTGLSGGAVPGDGAVVLSLARLADLGPVDAAALRVSAGAGALNAAVSRHAAPVGLHFAPDPSSQAASTIGGNVAENAGGPHCLRHGVTLQHLRRLDWLDARGRAWTTGTGAPAARGLDLVGLLCGSEGTLGVVTGAELSLVPLPAAEATLLAEFPCLQDATGAVVRLLGAGLLPVAVEMVDRAMLEAVEAAFAFGFATDVDAVMIAEFAGSAEAAAEDAARAAELLGLAGARTVRLAADADERARLWTCRKQAFGAVGRLAPGYVTMDVVVPLGNLPALVEAIGAIKAEHGVQVATAFHAGDGNLHPGVHYDDRDPDLRRRAHAAADAILHRAIALEGSVTGEHGVGLEKLHAVPWQLDAGAARLMAGLKAAFDPDGLLNPGKALPAHAPRWAEPPPVPTAVRFRWDDLCVTVPGDADLGQVQAAALARGLWLPLGAVRGQEAGGPGLGTLPPLAAALAVLRTGPLAVGGLTLRDLLLEIWAEDGAGRPFHAGAPVFKNVVGYGLAHLLAGAQGMLATVRGATLKLAPAPELLAWRRFAAPGADAGPLRPVLAQREPGPGAPVLVADAEAGTLLVLAAGRGRSWDLPAWLRRLEAAAAAGGLALTGGGEFPFTQVPPRLADLVPEWAVAGPDWTALTAADGGPCPADHGARRWIRQVSPPLVWTPEPVAAAGIDADRVYAGGRPTLPPAPPPGVPRDLLARLKALFDPDGRLPCAPWLDATKVRP
ncbi:MAG: FAD-linked oxidase C-terminal domain-containing protein [Candidatus Krumholzibacteriia bacterium]